MRSELGKACRKHFRQKMKAEFPAYQEDKSQAVPQGWYVWTWKHPSNIFFHILLVIAPKSDEFTTEAAWDLDGKMPHSMSIIDGDPEEILAAPIHFRTHVLWCSDPFGHWWKLVARPEKCEEDFLYQDPVSDCLPLIPAAVEDAGAKLKEFVLPLFEKIASTPQRQNRVSHKAPR